jgi:hypothetical protein
MSMERLHVHGLGYDIMFCIRGRYGNYMPMVHIKQNLGRYYGRVLKGTRKILVCHRSLLACGSITLNLL